MLKFQTVIKSAAILAGWTIIGVACGEDCSSEQPGIYAISAYRVNEQSGSIDNRTGEITFNRELNSSDTVQFQLLGFQIEPVVNYLSFHSHTAVFSGAMASCMPPDPNPSQKYAAVEITSNHPFVSDSKAYQAGESLNEIFSIYDSGNPLETDLINYYAFKEGMFLSLNTAPATHQAHQFKFKITLDDGSIFTANSETLTITP